MKSRAKQPLMIQYNVPASKSTNIVREAFPQALKIY